MSGKHAFLSPSQSHWVNYDPDKLRLSWMNSQKAMEGTALHAFASMSINFKIKLANHKKAINQFVNDAIGFDMQSEQVLYYSDNCFGTADAILFEDGILRVHDLKTGVHPAMMRQLFVYCAIFCLEYDMDPSKITMICRIYQGSGYIEEEADPVLIQEYMNTIITQDAIIDNLKNI